MISFLGLSRLNVGLFLCEGQYLATRESIWVGDSMFLLFFIHQLQTKIRQFENIQMIRVAS